MHFLCALRVPRWIVRAQTCDQVFRFILIAFLACAGPKRCNELSHKMLGVFLNLFFQYLGEVAYSYVFSCSAKIECNELSHQSLNSFSMFPNVSLNVFGIRCVGALPNGEFIMLQMYKLCLLPFIWTFGPMSTFGSKCRKFSLWGATCFFNQNVHQNMLAFY